VWRRHFFGDDLDTHAGAARHLAAAAGAKLDVVHRGTGRMKRIGNELPVRMSALGPDSTMSST